MKKLYTAPALNEVGAIATLTAAFGTSSRRDFSEFPQVQAGTGSFDVCDGNPGNNPPGEFCLGN